MKLEDIRGALPHKKEKKPEVPRKLTTVWGDMTDPLHVRYEYPRPLLVREGCTMLNGLWDCAFTKEAFRPARLDGHILVPFSPESSLSGVGRRLMPDEYLWYERKVPAPRLGPGERCILHFGACDQMAAVFINGLRALMHTGGYLPFSVDITQMLDPGEPDFLITVRVQDLTDTSYHSRGKQKLEPGGMYYTAQSGLWQSVWMEVVPETYIEDLLFEPLQDLSGVRLRVKTSCGNGGQAEALSVRVFEPTAAYSADDKRLRAGTPVCELTGSRRSLKIRLSDAKCWSPQSPWIYPVEITLGQDRVQSYFAVRSFGIMKDEQNIPRVCLNGRPIFLNGVLDQGYWPDGLYTAPSDEAFVYDIEQMKRLGFNMLRKHAKIEDRRWYYHCDRLGMLVWQDMVNGGGKYSSVLLTYLPTGICVPGPLLKPGPDGHPAGTVPALPGKIEQSLTGRRSKAGRTQFGRECAGTIKLLRGQPCVMTWVIFNEGWGQFDTGLLTSLVRRKDPFRLVDAASGWFEHGEGDFKSVHNYFRPLAVYRDARANVLSEFGGHVYHIDGHSMFEKTYGYHTCETAEEFGKSFMGLMEQLPGLCRQGLCGAVYTQVSDIEEETNGLLTYDRRVCKVTDADAARLAEMFSGL